MRSRWRRFRSRVKSRRANRDIFREATATVDTYLRNFGRSHDTADRLRSYAEERQHTLEPSDPVQNLVSLLLLTPAAARAQQEMDKNPHGFRQHGSKLFELIDFNDAYVSTVLALDQQHLNSFNRVLKSAMDAVCQRAGATTFSEEQFDAIARGLTREIAVYKTARECGLTVRMTSRREDAMGVDMVVTDATTGRSVNLDVKSPSSYRYRLIDLVREGRMSEHERMQADVKGYAHEVNGRGPEAVQVVLFRIDANELGEIVDFRFQEPQKLNDRLRGILRELSQE